ncbi:uncharacterized protein BXIN_0979 [Babesia sp. Xinjiang]|uniref:uncharacterized protein n=1 Tax=Babesia sp. Xinjiang TaxID=462227 RepID=UPI000A231ACF|nr:uncharacterized protein BXIN_0979 [Babesia sp. Xinjiang]ORM42200.1 hypothetical protein BXIN_0979 [Babesia sp. Xinjiang]
MLHIRTTGRCALQFIITIVSGTQADRQSSGLGTFLINATKIVGRHADAKKLMCTVLKINRRAVSFYRNKCGFVDDESDPSSVDFENREKHIYHILKLELDPPSTSNHDANETDPETSES